MDGAQLVAWFGRTESALVVVAGLAAGMLCWRAARRIKNGKRLIRVAKALICLSMAALYGVNLYTPLDAVAFSLLARTLVILLISTLVAREIQDGRLPKA